MVSLTNNACGAVLLYAEADLQSVSTEPGISNPLNITNIQALADYKSVSQWWRIANPPQQAVGRHNKKKAARRPGSLSSSCGSALAVTLSAVLLAVDGDNGAEVGAFLAVAQFVLADFGCAFLLAIQIVGAGAVLRAGGKQSHESNNRD